MFFTLNKCVCDYVCIKLEIYIQYTHVVLALYHVLYDSPAALRFSYTAILQKIIHVPCARVTRTRSKRTGAVDGDTLTSAQPLTKCPSWKQLAAVVRGPDRSVSLGAHCFR